MAKETFFYGMGSVLPNCSAGCSPFIGLLPCQGSPIWCAHQFLCLVALLQVILTYGMETGFFRYANKEKDPIRVFSTTFLVSPLDHAVLYAGTPVSETAGFYAGRHRHEAALPAVAGDHLCVDVLGAIPFATCGSKKGRYVLP